MRLASHLKFSKYIFFPDHGSYHCLIDIFMITLRYIHFSPLWSAPPSSLITFQTFIRRTLFIRFFFKKIENIAELYVLLKRGWSYCMNCYCLNFLFWNGVVLLHEPDILSSEIYVIDCRIISRTDCIVVTFFSWSIIICIRMLLFIWWWIVLQYLYLQM
jgi:hypothetical protein